MSSIHEAFWNAFQKNKEQPSIQELQSELKKISEALTLTLNINTSPKQLIISPQGRKEYFAIAYDVIGQAPTLEDWEFLFANPAISLPFSFKVGEYEINSDQIECLALNSAEFPDDIALRLYHESYTRKEGERKNALTIGLYQALDKILGEEVSTFDIQYAEFGIEANEGESVFPLSQLPEYIQWKKSQRAISGIRFPKEDISLLEGEIDELPSKLVLNRGLKYYEFSKQFPHVLTLTLDLDHCDEKGQPLGDLNDVFSVENILYQEICKEQQGHFIATQTHNQKRIIHYYVNSTESIDNIISQLPKELKQCSYSHNVVFDPFWLVLEEYIYM